MTGTTISAKPMPAGKSRRFTRRFAVAFLALAFLALAALGAIAFHALKPPVMPVPQGEFCFYHWKTVYNPGPDEELFLAALQSPRIYLRFFDVGQGEPHSKKGGAVPVATAYFKKKPTLPVVPVVFLHNAALTQELTPQNAPALAEKITARVQKMLTGNKLTPAKELQIDCDWTASTRNGYFALLREIKARLPKDWELSTTLRLHQYRDQKQSGIPPVDRVSLMLYNMGSLREDGPQNSILDPHIAANYLRGAYPLELDIALPLFSWAVVFDGQGNYLGLLREAPEDLDNPALYEKLPDGRYRLLQDAPNPRLQKGVILRLERSKPEDLRKVAALAKKLPKRSGRVIFYHLDKNCLQGWAPEGLKNL